MFWELLKNGFGECRKKPPRPDINRKTGDPFTRSLFPATRDSDWCGEFRPRKTQPKPAETPSDDVLEI